MKSIFFGALLTAACFSASAQYTPDAAPNSDAPHRKFDKSKLFAGGNFALSFGTYSLVNISPQIGYHFSERFAAGAGIEYIHYGYSNDQYRATQSYAGMNIFGRFYPIQNFFIQAQPEANYVWGRYHFFDETPDQVLSSRIVPTLLIGGGAGIPAGPGFITISVLYDVVQDNLSPYYHQAVYGFGYTFGF